MRKKLPAIVARMFLCALLLPATRAASQPGLFNGQIASNLLRQIASGLTAHNRDRMLGAFDLDRMTDGPLFQQQVTSLFQQSATIRVQFNQVQTSMDGSRGLATAHIEMEAENNDDRLPPLRKQAELHLTAANSGHGWKFTGVQPRTFFSIQP